MYLLPKIFPFFLGFGFLDALKRDVLTEGI